MRHALGYRSADAGREGCGGGEARPDVAQQRPPPVALRHSGSARPRRQEVLRQVLRRLDRSHKHPTAAVYLTEGRPHPRRRVP